MRARFGFGTRPRPRPALADYDEGGWLLIPQETLDAIDGDDWLANWMIGHHGTRKHGRRR
jgi:hypothetical protein